MSFRTAVLECVLGHKNDKKYAIEESKRSLRERGVSILNRLKQTVLHDKILVLVFKQAIHLKSTWCMKYKLLGYNDPCYRVFATKMKIIKSYILTKMQVSKRKCEIYSQTMRIRPNNILIVIICISMFHIVVLHYDMPPWVGSKINLIEYKVL